MKTHAVEDHNDPLEDLYLSEEVFHLGVVGHPSKPVAYIWRKGPDAALVWARAQREYLSRTSMPWLAGIEPKVLNPAQAKRYRNEQGQALFPPPPSTAAQQPN